jgi:hypothetical protein
MESHGQSGAPIDKFYIDRNTSYSVKISPNPFGICTEHLEQGLVTNKQLLRRRIGTRVLIRPSLVWAICSRSIATKPCCTIALYTSPALGFANSRSR